MSQTRDQLWVEERVRALEKRSRVLLAAVVSLAALTASVFIMGQAKAAPSNVIEVERLVLRGPDGSPRALLAPTSDGRGAALTFFRPDKSSAVLVGIQNDGWPVVELVGRNGESRGLFGLNGKDDPNIEMNDGNGKRRVFVGVGRGNGIVGVSDGEGRARASLSESASGDGGLSLFGEAGGDLGGMFQAAGQVKLYVVGKDGKTAFSVP